MMFSHERAPSRWWSEGGAVCRARAPSSHHTTSPPPKLAARALDHRDLPAPPKLLVGILVAVARLALRDDLDLLDVRHLVAAEPGLAGDHRLFAAAVDLGQRHAGAEGTVTGRDAEP